MECFKNVDDDYGLILRHDNKSIWLENIRDAKREFYQIVNSDGNILNKAAYDFICEKTFSGFNYNAYDNYVKLFEIMGIQKLKGFKDLMKEKKMYVTELARVANIPRTTISRIAVCATPFDKVTVNNALAISKALDMTIEEIYDTLYFERISS